MVSGTLWYRQSSIVDTTMYVVQCELVGRGADGSGWLVSRENWPILTVGNGHLVFGIHGCTVCVAQLSGTVHIAATVVHLMGAISTMKPADTHVDLGWPSLYRLWCCCQLRLEFR
jgi:hypothetical protein